jgi:hypothetical protein
MLHPRLAAQRGHRSRRCDRLTVELFPFSEVGDQRGGCELFYSISRKRAKRPTGLLERLSVSARDPRVYVLPLQRGSHRKGRLDLVGELS